LLTFVAGSTVVENITNYLLGPPTGQGRSVHTQINRLENLVCLNPAYHQEFGNGYFVLEPVGDALAGLDPNGLLSRYDVRFSWLPQYRCGEWCSNNKRTPKSNSNKVMQFPVIMKVGTILNRIRRWGNEDAGDGDNNSEEGSVELQSEGDWGLVQVLDPGVAMEEAGDPTLVNRDVFRYPRLARRPGLPQGSGRAPVRLQTGFTFSLTTPDPLHYPLPHPDLLSIHAALMRVARAAGVTAFEEDEWDSQDEEDLEQQQDEGAGEDLSYALRRFLEDTVSPGDLVRES